MARERSGQLAHAKAEFEEYLRRYPTGEAADRVARRLATLRAASTAARTGTGGGAEGAAVWSVEGGFGQTYRYDSTRVDNTVTAGAPGSGTAPTSQSQSSNSLYNDLDVLARRRGQRFDLLARTSLTYAKNFAGPSPTSANDASTRVSIASVEIDDRILNMFARLGRQVQNFDGALGTFDGLFAAWQIPAGYRRKPNRRISGRTNQPWIANLPASSGQLPCPTRRSESTGTRVSSTVNGRTTG